MAQMVEHSGRCCGVRHIFGMDRTSVAELEDLIEELDTEEDQGNRLIEVILSSRQVGDRELGGTNNGWHPSVVAAGGWPAVMQRLGFRLVSRFNNSNSGRDCFIFHRVPEFKSLYQDDLPFAWDHTAYFAGAVVEAPRIVWSMYCNVLRTGRGRMWHTREEAVRAAPRAQRIDRIDVFSDGTHRWSEGV